MEVDEVEALRVADAAAEDEVQFAHWCFPCGLALGRGEAAPPISAAQRTVDDAEMKYVVVHLHKLLQPDAE